VVAETISSVTGTLFINNVQLGAAFTGASASAVATRIQQTEIEGITAQAIDGRLYIYSDGYTSDTADSTLGQGNVT
jgi:hypothetical protein